VSLCACAIRAPRGKHHFNVFTPAFAERRIFGSRKAVSSSPVWVGRGSSEGSFPCKDRSRSFFRIFVPHRGCDLQYLNLFV